MPKRQDSASGDTSPPRGGAADYDPFAMAVGIARKRRLFTADEHARTVASILAVESIHGEIIETMPDRRGLELGMPTRQFEVGGGGGN
jgi:hypothetical protein